MIGSKRVIRIIPIRAIFIATLFLVYYPMVPFSPPILRVSDSFWGSLR